MQARELRIGNLVKRKSVVVKCDYMSMSNCDAVPEQYEPIPLTEECLLRFGFESKNPVLFTNSDGDSFYLDDTKIKHVHQLQNLYFALTGEELTYNG